jgi:hypothetical protein
MKKICLMTTGGTVASRRHGEIGHVVADVSGLELRAMLHDPLPGVEIQVSCGGEVVSAFVWDEEIDDASDGGPETVDSSLGGFAQGL